MSDNGIGIIIVIAVLVIVAIAALLIFSSVLNVLSKNVFWFGILVGIPIGIGGTLGFLRIRKYLKTHAVVEIQEQ